MSQEKTLRNLEELGFSKTEAQIYLLLGKRGPQRAKDIVAYLKINRTRLYEILKVLEKKGLIHATLEYPAKFGAEPFDKVLDLFVKAKMEDALRIKEDAKRLIEDWQSISLHETVEQRPRFMVFEGRNYIYPHLRQMIQETEKELLLITSPSGLIRTEQYGLLEMVFQHSKKEKIVTRYLAEITPQNVRLMRQFLARIKTPGSFEGRSPNLGLQLTSRMLIKDNSEVVFFLNKTNGEIDDSDDICLWTNSNSIVNSFKAMFEDSWRSSIDLEKKIKEIETGKTAPQTFVICNEESAKKEYLEKILSTKKELLIITSPQGVLNLETKILQLKELHQRNVTIKVIAPLTSENLKAAQQIFRYCKIRHAAINYVTTTIIDGQHLFQFKTPQNQRQPDSSDQFESTIYSNDSEYVGKTRLMFSEMWNNAQTPFLSQSEPQIVSSESAMHSPPDENRVKAYRIVDKYVEDAVFLGVDAQKNILKRILSAKRVKIEDPLKESVIQYGSVAQAFVYPPESTNLPNMLIRVFHSNAQSSFGADNWLFIGILRQTSEGYTYVPAVYVGTNPKSVAFWKNNNPGFWNDKNCLLFKKDQLEVRVQGNTMFAGWTKPISLSPFLFTLPPACMFFEGYGDLRTSISKIAVPLGHLIVHEINAFEAFVTFYNPSWKYSAPGTEGLFMRDSIFTLNPTSKN